MAALHRYARELAHGGLLDGLASFAELERRISALPSAGQRGLAFEAFAEAYLSTQKIVQADQVWPDGHVPISLLREHRLPERVLGADGVFRTWSGDLTAYQVKFRTGRAPLTWTELSTFMGLTDQVHERVLFTNSDDLPEVMNERSGFYCIRGSDLDRLGQADFVAIRQWLETGAARPVRKSPRARCLRTLLDADWPQRITKGATAAGAW
jgi:hypothetical protein